MKRNSQKTVPLSRVACVWKHFFSGQPLLFVFVIGMFIVNNVFAKPLYLKSVDGKLGVFEREAQLQHLSVNETPQSREKWDIIKGLRKLCPGTCQSNVRLQHLSVNVVEGIPNLCPGTYEVSSKPASGCIQTWLSCNVNGENLTEPHCASQSLGCLNSIERFGFPKCTPVYKWMKLTFPNGQEKMLKLNVACFCA